MTRASRTGRASVMPAPAFAGVNSGGHPGFSVFLRLTALRLRVGQVWREWHPWTTFLSYRYPRLPVGGQVPMG